MKTEVLQSFVRWITLVAVSFFMIVPQTGFCLCADCSCPANVSKFQKGNVVPKESLSAPLSNSPSACSCCKNKRKAGEKTSPVSEDCCKSKETSEKPTDPSRQCSCECDSGKKPSAPTIQPSVFRSVFEFPTPESLPSIATELVPAFCDRVPFSASIVSWTALLPLRLHLFLLVLRN